MRKNTSSILGLDWGTSSFRLFELDADGAMTNVLRSDRGVASFNGDGFEAYLREQLDELGSDYESLLACGMIGSSLGWLDAGYVECPADLSAIAANLRQLPFGDDAWIAPGLRCRSPLGEPDVMRGEETQLLGWLSTNRRSYQEALVCLPGTHAKWVLIRDGKIESFVTTPTGEVFALLRRHSTLVNGEQSPSEVAFSAGVELAGRYPRLSETLFATRSRSLTGDLAPEHAAEFLSGLLIGSEARAAIDRWSRPEQVVLIGDTALCERYRAALAHLGIRSDIENGDEMVFRGLAALHRARTS